MEKARVNKEYEQICEDLKPGSGKIWANKLTVPKCPKLSGFMNKENVRTDLNKDINYPKSLDRPINDRKSSYLDKRKRHNLYIKDLEMS